jgi:hypothetical protein
VDSFATDYFNHMHSACGWSKEDFMALVRDFESVVLDIARPNFSIITLISKEPDARDMKKFRPIRA